MSNHLIHLYEKYKEIYEKTGNHKSDMIRYYRKLKNMNIVPFHNIYHQVKNKIPSYEDLSSKNINLNKEISHIPYNDKIEKINTEKSILILKNKNSNIEYISILEKELKGIVNSSYQPHYKNIIWMNPFQKIEKKKKIKDFFM